MENEVSSVSRIAVMLVSMAILISIVWVTVGIGNRIKGDSYNKASSITEGIESSQIKSLAINGETLMPKAAAYALLNQSDKVVVRLEYTDPNGVLTTVTPGNTDWTATGGKSGTYTSISDVLKDEIHGKAKVTVQEYGDALYKVSIISVDY